MLRFITLKSDFRFILLIAITIAASILNANSVAAVSDFDLDATLARAEALRAEGKWRDAGELIEASYETAVATNATDEALITLLDEGSDILLNLEDLVASGRFGERALAVLGERGNPTGIARAQILLAQTYYWSDEIEKAESLLNAVLAAAANGLLDDADAETTAVAFLARARFRTGDNEAAIAAIEPFIEESDTFHAASKDPRFLALRQLALAYRNKASEAGRPALEKALVYARQAADVLLEEGDGADLNYTVALETVARIEWMLDLRIESIAHLREAISQLEDGGAATTRDYVLMTGYLCDRLTKTGALSEAVEWGETAVAVAKDIFFERYRGPNGVSQDDRIFLNFAIANYLTALRANADDAGAISASELSSAFASAQLASTSLVAEALGVTAAEIRDSSPRLRGMARKVREIQTRIDEIDTSASLFAADPVKYASQIGALQRARSEHASELRHLQARIAETDPAFHGLWSGETVDPSALQYRLGADEAFIQLVTANNSVHVFVVTREEVVWRRSDDESSELCERVASLRRSLSQSTSVDCNGVVSLTAEPELKKFDPADAFRIYQLTLGAAEDALANKSRWTISAHGLLASVPYAALVVDAPPADFERSGRLSDLAWLGARKAVMLAPSASSLVAMRSPGAPGAQRVRPDLRIAAAGAPCLGRYDAPDCGRLMERDLAQSASAGRTGGFRNAVLASGDIGALPELPGAFFEINAIKARFAGADISLVGEAFQKNAFVARKWENYDVVSLSTHAVQLTEDDTAQAAIVFSPPGAQTGDDDSGASQFLRSSEIASLSMPVDWAILSSCNTIVSGQRRDDAISGLALAFMQAGAEAIVFSTFEVRDDASPAIVPAMLDAYVKNPGAGKAEALRLTIEAILADPSRRDLHHPSAWAPFAVMGAGQ